MVGKKKKTVIWTIIRLSILAIVLIGGTITVSTLLKNEEKKLKKEAATAQEAEEDEKESKNGFLQKPVDSTEESEEEETEPSEEDEQNAGFDYDEFYENGVDYDEISEVMTQLAETGDLKYGKFTLEGESYQLGDSTSKFIQNGYEPLTVISGINAHTLLPVPFSLDGETKFLGFIFNPTDHICDVQDTILVKINFYPCSNVTVGDNLTFETEDYNSILGDKTGTFYQSREVSVWSTGKNIGDSYVLVYYGATESTIFGAVSSGILEIRIGVWCFEGEYDQCVKES
ncbi:MAG: hypothetical protein MJ153_08130 [Clostridia bacterium]|nr:hypothetical protein [Clostridia bacterium]